jgi:hypothetical protein
MWVVIGKTALITFLAVGSAALVVTYICKSRAKGRPRPES